MRSVRARWADGGTAGRGDVLTARPVHGTVLLEVAGVSKRFGPLRVLDEVDLRVRAGELVALVGENGAGKSTLVKCIARAFPPDGGRILLAGDPLADDPGAAQAQGLGVVWQDLALCDNLDTVANLFLGREHRALLLSDAAMHAHAQDLLAGLGIRIDDLRRPVSLLSGGQRQSIAIARAIMQRPRVLVLDEPTAALGVVEARAVEQLLARLRREGVALLLISHRIELVFDLADRIVVLREGRVVADVATTEVHPDDVVALMSGIETDSAARRQLRRLRSLASQLSEVEPTRSLPLIVSAMATALDQDSLCVHLLEPSDDGAPVLVRRAAVGLHDPLLASMARVPVGVDGGVVGLAAEGDQLVVIEDVRADPVTAGLRDAAVRAGVLSTWAAPILGARGLLGVVSGYGAGVGRPRPEQLELLSVYAGHAAAAIEREALLAEVTRRNRILETLREVLETLAGPEHLRGGLRITLLALCRGIGADAVAVHEVHDGALRTGAGTEVVLLDAVDAATARAEMAAAAALDHPRAGRAEAVGERVARVTLTLDDGPAVLTAWWARPAAMGQDALAVLDDAARSLRLAIEREALLGAHQEADALRRVTSLQRDFLSRLSHELRTPLTAIHGYASTLRQPDVTWDLDSERRFLDSIVAESARMGRLVADLLDSSAIEAGVLRLQPHWCDLGLVLEAAVGCVPTSGTVVSVDCDPALGPVWGDHDRLEQVFVNLVGNAVHHGAAPVLVSARPGRDAGTVDVLVVDHGPGVPHELVERAFEPHVRGDGPASGAGLGLPIARGIVEAHRGTIAIAPSRAGTIVRVTLPVDPPVDPSVDAPVHPASAEQG
jgi:signal transduction histidine kinase/ABC-type branched-subunit amino acid transport system ATPase component